MTVASKRHLAAIHALPCVVCLHCYGRRMPCDEAHHLESVRGPHSDFATVPLCKSCHDSLHGQHRRGFYLAHKLDDVKLLALTVELFETCGLIATARQGTLETAAKIADQYPDTLDSIGAPGSGTFRAVSKAAAAIRALAQKEG